MVLTKSLLTVALVLLDAAVQGILIAWLKRCTNTDCPHQVTLIHLHSLRSSLSEQKKPKDVAAMLAP